MTKHKIGQLILFLSFLLVGIAFVSTYFFTGENRVYEKTGTVQISNSIYDISQISELLDDKSFIYFKNKEDSSQLYRYYFQDDSSKAVGEIKNGRIGKNAFCKLGDNLYFYAAVDDGEALRNQLHRIDLRTNSLSLVPNQAADDSLAGITAYRLQNSILTLKNIVNGDGSISTFFHIFDTGDETWRKLDENRWDPDTKSGSALSAFYADGNYLYAIKDIYTENGGKAESWFLQCNTSLDIHEKILLTGDILHFLKSGRILEMNVQGAYIYLRNASSEGYLGRIENGAVETVIDKAKYLSVSKGCDGGQGVYFYRRSNIILYFKEDGFLDSFQIELEDGQSIKAAYTNGKDLLLECYQIRDGQLLPDKINFYQYR